MSRHVHDVPQTTPCGFCDVGPSADELALEILDAALRRVSLSYETPHRVRVSHIAESAAGMLSGALMIARDGDLIRELFDVRDAAIRASVTAEVAESSADFHAGYDAAQRVAA